jgi:hypothetical protein
MINNFWLFVLLCLVVACNPTTPQEESGNTGLTFEFSKQPPPISAAEKDHWCRFGFESAAVIGADPINSNRRLFTLSEGPHKVTVDYGNIVASFVLKKSGNKVKIFTSDNNPECLSNKSNFSIESTGTAFHYNNNKHIDFEVQLVPMANGIQVALEMAPGAGYGIIVRR